MVGNDTRSYFCSFFNRNTFQEVVLRCFSYKRGNSWWIQSHRFFLAVLQILHLFEFLISDVLNVAIKHLLNLLPYFVFNILMFCKQISQDSCSIGSGISTRSKKILEITNKILNSIEILIHLINLLNLFIFQQLLLNQQIEYTLRSHLIAIRFTILIMLGDLELLLDNISSVAVKFIPHSTHLTIL